MKNTFELEMAFVESGGARPTLIFAENKDFSGNGKQQLVNYIGVLIANGLGDNIKELHLINCRLEELPPIVFGLVNLEILVLDKNPLNILMIPDDVFRKITTVSLQECQMTQWPSHIAKLPNLKSLNLSRNKFQEMTLTGPLSSMEELSVNDCGLSRVDATAMQQLPNLTTFSASDNLLSENTVDFRGLTRLQRVNLDNNHFIKMPSSLQQSLVLENLSMQNNYFFSYESIHFASYSLIRLNLSGNYLSNDNFEITFYGDAGPTLDVINETRERKHRNVIFERIYEVALEHPDEARSLGRNFIESLDQPENSELKDKLYQLLALKYQKKLPLDFGLFVLVECLVGTDEKFIDLAFKAVQKRYQIGHLLPCAFISVVKDESQTAYNFNDLIPYIGPKKNQDFICRVLDKLKGPEFAQVRWDFNRFLSYFLMKSSAGNYETVSFFLIYSCKGVDKEFLKAYKALLKSEGALDESVGAIEFVVPFLRNQDTLEFATNRQQLSALLAEADSEENYPLQYDGFFLSLLVTESYVADFQPAQSYISEAVLGARGSSICNFTEFLQDPSPSPVHQTAYTVPHAMKVSLRKPTSVAADVVSTSITRRKAQSQSLPLLQRVSLPVQPLLRDQQLQLPPPMLSSSSAAAILVHKRKPEDGREACLLKRGRPE